MRYISSRSTASFRDRSLQVYDGIHAMVPRACRALRSVPPRTDAGVGELQMSRLDPFDADVPEAFAKDLREEGCQEIFLFGSLATGEVTRSSDIDLGIKSYPKQKSFRIYGRLMSRMDHGFDLVDFDSDRSMFEVLERIGEIRRIA